MTTYEDVCIFASHDMEFNVPRETAVPLPVKPYGIQGKPRSRSIPTTASNAADNITGVFYDP